VLDAARSRFAESGYEKTSVRAIARAAGVDAALVHHYFGTKEQLFLAALDFPLEPSLIAGLITSGDRARAGERIVRFAMSLWDQDPVRERLLAMLRTAATNEQVAELFRGFVQRELVGHVARALGAPRADLRVELVMAQILGLAMARYVFRIEPLASAGTEELVQLVGPVFQHYLSGGLSGGGPGAPGAGGD
jgi:AcrR family transcriptional regulator